MKAYLLDSSIRLLPKLRSITACKVLIQRLEVVCQETCFYLEMDLKMSAILSTLTGHIKSWWRQCQWLRCQYYCWRAGDKEEVAIWPLIPRWRSRISSCRMYDWMCECFVLLLILFVLFMTPPALSPVLSHIQEMLFLLSLTAAGQLENSWSSCHQFFLVS